MNRIFLIGILSTLASVALAAEPSPESRAMLDRIGMEVNANLQCTGANISLREKLSALESEVKRLTEKYETKPDSK